MISLDVDISFLSRYFNIGTRALEQYQNKSIVQIMQIEAQRGNTKAAEFLMKITSNPEELAKVFQLVEPKNRYLILAHMNKEDLMKIMSYLEPEELLLGLSIFNQEAIVKLMQNLPQETLTKVVLEKMDASKFVKNLPTKFLDEFMESDKLDRSMFMEALQEIDDEQLQKMMEHFTGQPCYQEKGEIVEQLGSLNDDNFMKAMRSFEPEGKQQLIINMLKKTPDLFEEFSVEAMTHPFKTMEKSEILKSLSILETEELLPMVQEMPQEVMALVATQINPEMLAKVLCADFKNVIASCGFDM